MEEASQEALESDTSVPNIARMYDYWLGGKDNFPAGGPLTRLTGGRLEN
jgi:S-adenosyl methyltransferase